jgi:hypothetical protein
MHVMALGWSVVRACGRSSWTGPGGFRCSGRTTGAALITCGVARSIALRRDGRSMIINATPSTCSTRNVAASTAVIGAPS